MRFIYLLILLPFLYFSVHAQQIGDPVWEWVHIMEGKSSWYEGIEGKPQLAPHSSDTLLLGAVDGPHPMVLNGDTVSTPGSDGIWLSLMDTNGHSLKSMWITCDKKIDLFSLIASDRGTFYMLIQSEGKVTWNQKTSWNTSIPRYFILEIDTSLTLLKRDAFSNSSNRLTGFAHFQDSLFAFSFDDGIYSQDVILVDRQMNSIQQLSLRDDFIWTAHVSFIDSSLFIYGSGDGPMNVYVEPGNFSISDTSSNAQGFIVRTSLDGAATSVRTFPFSIESLAKNHNGALVAGGMVEDSFEFDGIHYVPPQPYSIPALLVELDPQLQILKWSTLESDSLGSILLIRMILVNPDSSYTLILTQDEGSYTGAPAYTPAAGIYLCKLDKAGQLVSKNRIAEYSLSIWGDDFVQLFEMNEQYYISSVCSYKGVFSDSIIDFPYESAFWGKLDRYTQGLTASIPHIPGGINDRKTKNQILPYPNPTTGHVQFKSEINIAQAAAIDVTGRRYGLPIQNESIDLSDLPQGMYWLEIITADQEKVMAPILRQ